MPIHILTNHIIRNIEKFQNVEKNLPVEFLFIFNGIREKKINGFSQSKNFYFIKKNNGPGPARNLGIKKSKANWLLFLDSDDDLIVRNLPKLINFIKNKNCNFLAVNFLTNYKTYEKNHKKFQLNHKHSILKEKIRLFLNQKLEYAIIFYLFKKGFLKKYKIFFLKGYFEDIFFHLKILFFNKDRKILYFKKKIYFKKYNSSSITALLTKKHLDDFINAWLNVIRFLKRKYAKTDELENLYQFTLRGVLGYLMKRVENCNLSTAKKKRLKTFVINILKIYINKNFIVQTKYDKYAKDYLN